MPRLLDGGIAEDPSQSFTEHTASLCAIKCQLRHLCHLFRCNALTAECDLYDKIGFRKILNVTGNQFFQKMPTSKLFQHEHIKLLHLFDDDNDDDDNDTFPLKSSVFLVQ